MQPSRSALRVSQLFKDKPICTSCRHTIQKRALTTRSPRSQSRKASTAALPQDNDLESFSSFELPPPLPEDSSYDPLKSSRARGKATLVPSRYQYRSPRYDRGPLAPHRPPPVTDPASREFTPGPFSTPRLETTYHSTLAPDFMTLTYQHRPPGFVPPEKGPRLRPWTYDSPYVANRQLRGPRGGDVLRLLRKPITFRNVPMIEEIILHSFVKEITKDGSGPLHVAGMVLQQISNHRVTTHVSKHPETGFGLIRGKSCSATVHLKGEDMYHFLDKLVNVVMPRIKDWRGVRATTGDNSGNITFGFEPEVVSTFPEVEGNYDAYPPKLIPGVHVTVKTTARADKDARLLLEGFGVPFYGKIVD